MRAWELARSGAWARAGAREQAGALACMGIRPWRNERKDANPRSGRVFAGAETLDEYEVRGYSEYEVLLVYEVLLGCWYPSARAEYGARIPRLGSHPSFSLASLV